jgi:hypothetical protein
LIGLLPPITGAKWHATHELLLKIGPSPSLAASVVPNASLPSRNSFRSCMLSPSRGLPSSDRLAIPATELPTAPARTRHATSVHARKGLAVFMGIPL